MVREIKGNTELGKVNENTSFFQGDDETIKVFVEDDKLNAVDISGASSIEYQIYDENGSKVTKTLSGDITITDGANGEFEIPVASGDTSGIEGKFDHEAQITDGDTSTLFQGTVRIRGTNI